jgi:hypothetical protein
MSNETVRTNGVETARGTTVRDEFGGKQVVVAAETAAAAVAAREAAAVQSRYVMAERHPRDIEDFRVRLENECKRPSFAEVALYKKPVGKKFEDGQWKQEVKEGPSIRFIETALRCYRNVFPEVVTVFDSDTVRICRVSVTDLEANLTYATEVLVNKQVERRGVEGRDKKIEPPKDRIVISERTNTYGDKVFTVVATDDEVLIKQNALLSKAIRTNGQRLLPGDIVENCVRMVRETLKTRDAKDPDAAKRRIVDAFAEVGVGPVDLQAYLGHPIERVQPAELEELRGVYTALKEGEATWGEIMMAKNSSGSAEESERIAKEKLAKGQQQSQEHAAAPAANPENAKQTPSEQPGTGGEPKPRLQFGKKPSGKDPSGGYPD